MEKKIKEKLKGSKKGETISPTSWVIKLDSLPRQYPHIVVCPHCGNEADSTNCTAKERKEYGCGRSWDCCSVAYKCTVCGLRMVSRLPAPDY